MIRLSKFEVSAFADSGTVPRLIEYFAQRGLTPQRVEAWRAGELIHALFEQDGLAPHDAQVIAEKMRSSVLVQDVAVSFPVADPSLA
jgi:hypothetical protein